MKKYLLVLTTTLCASWAFWGTSLNARSEILKPNEKVGPSVYQLLGKSSFQGDKVSIPVLVILKDQADLTQVNERLSKEEKGRAVYQALTATAQTSQGSLRQWLAEKNISFKPFWIINMIALESVTQQQLTEIAAREDVAKIIGNPAVKQSALPWVGFTAADVAHEKGVGDNITSTKAPQVWQQFGTRGKGITVAGQDTGVDFTHPALVRQYRGNAGNAQYAHDYNWHDSFAKPLVVGSSNKCGYNLNHPCDDNDHGTHTMGTMLGEDTAGTTVGMAPDAQWIACRNMDAGTGTPASYLDCFQFFLAPTPIGGDSFTMGDPTQAPHVINNSWGCPPSEGCEGSEMIPALQALEAAGIFVVVSAGNDGPGCSTIQDQPASITDHTLSVGAINHRTNAMADFSSRGPSKLDGGLGPDVSAPGVNIKSSVPGGGYSQVFWSGTSMAGPHVVGAVALLWSAVPTLVGHIGETTALLRSTAHPVAVKESCGGVPGSAVPNNTSGYGMIDILAAVQKAKTAVSE